MTQTIGRAEPIAITLPAFTNLNVNTFASLFATILSQSLPLRLTKLLENNKQKPKRGEDVRRDEVSKSQVQHENLDWWRILRHR